MSEALTDPEGYLPSRAETEAVAARIATMSLPALMEQARALRHEGHGRRITFSPKVFIPLTRLCRDACGYCTFAESPRQARSAYLAREEVLAIARAGAAADCTEALFTLGDRPEQRYRAAREALSALGCDSTVAYLAETAGLVLKETGLLPHINAGVLSQSDVASLRQVSASQGLMLESTATDLTLKGGAHHGAASKQPLIRIEAIAAAGRAQAPFTTGILIGIGETRIDRIESLLAIRNLHARHGHIQEVIVQNFRPKSGTRMAGNDAATMDDLLWSIAAARILLGPTMHIQAPPNLSFARFPELLDAGIDDWGGVSPVTPDHVNPEARWPALDQLREATESAGLELAARLPIYPEFAAKAERWLAPEVRPAVLKQSDAEGLARQDAWSPGFATDPVAPAPRKGRTAAFGLDAILDRATRGERLAEGDITSLFAARGGGLDAVLGAADALRRRQNGDLVRYVVNRNINYTNVCGYRCGFCAFSKGRMAEHLRGKPYLVSLDEVSRRSGEAFARGATEVCMQGGIHPDYDGRTYLDLLAAAKRGAPAIHVHAFSPLEVLHGATSLGVAPRRYLAMLRDAGLGSLPGTAAEILDDEVRATLCPDKLSAQEWLEVARAAHEVGLRTTATIMFGHVDQPVHWARHILAIRDLQEATGGFTEFVPLPFVHMEAPLYIKGRARKGPTFRETLLMHAVARLALHPVIPNIQVSWVKLGAEGVRQALAAGVNDLGGTLMNESISRAAGTEHGQELAPAAMDALIRDAGRIPAQRTTLYAKAPEAQVMRSYGAETLAPLHFDPPTRRSGVVTLASAH